jgi:hypothetical protein
LQQVRPLAERAELFSEAAYGNTDSARRVDRFLDGAVGDRHKAGTDIAHIEEIADLFA